MFSGLLFIIFVLLIATLAPEGYAIDLIESPWTAAAITAATNLLLFLAIYFASAGFIKQIKRRKHLSYHIINIALIGYLCVVCFVLTPQRLLIDTPFETFLTSVAMLIIYFGGLIMYHAGSYYQRFLYPEAEVQSRWVFAIRQMRMWFPFVIPFVCFVFLGELLTLLPLGSWFSFLELGPEEPFAILTYFTFSATLVVLMAIFLPWLIQRVWLCKPLEDTDLWLRLVKVAQKANFRFAGIRTWTVMNQFHTAAIIGIIPRFRYIMFTRRLLHEIPIDSIEAILVHEIGHSYRKHLLIFPFIIFGMFVSAGLFSLFFSEGIYQYLEMKDAANPSALWKAMIPLSVLIPYIAIFALYFRYLFGFFSRLFERQADLHPFTVGTPPEHMIEALDQIGIVTGNTHNIPSWHHYSIAERIAFLQEAVKAPELVEKHHRKVRRWVCLYFIAFFAATTVLLSPILPQVPVIKEITDFVTKTNNTMIKMFTNKEVNHES